MIYLGDGSGDFCPSSKLKEEDHVMPRKIFPLWELIFSNPIWIKAEIHKWTDREEPEKVLLQIINKISLQAEGGKSTCAVHELLPASDCKLQTISASGHEALPQPLSVPQLMMS
ncbi:hypothetical protein Dsin_014132 [Dipteronia sinensis]|uniref:Uncharacterized protein n=1 Tax=Dipteronia sinensis TaxID=43782 RepID=A0AAE0EA14_9ROSI|nr:hypothetical protein Dsin_014132 [Dipteronia sinensis]